MKTWPPMYAAVGTAKDTATANQNKIWPLLKGIINQSCKHKTDEISSGQQDKRNDLERPILLRVKFAFKTRRGFSPSSTKLTPPAKMSSIANKPTTRKGNPINVAAKRRWLYLLSKSLIYNRFFCMQYAPEAVDAFSMTSFGTILLAKEAPMSVFRIMPCELKI